MYSVLQYLHFESQDLPVLGRNTVKIGKNLSDGTTGNRKRISDKEMDPRIAQGGLLQFGGGREYALSVRLSIIPPSRLLPSNHPVVLNRAEVRPLALGKVASVSRGA